MIQAYTPILLQNLINFFFQFHTLSHFAFPQFILAQQHSTQDSEFLIFLLYYLTQYSLITKIPHSLNP
jgi:hypothetical protein